MAEIPFEYLAVALETVRGTAVTPPTHYLPIEGKITPRSSKYKPAESRGVLAEITRSKTVRRWSEWEGSGPLETRWAPLLFALGLRSTPTPTIVTADATWLWTYVRAMTTDNLKSGTIFWGDPNVQIFRGAFGMVDEIVITSDATSEDGITCEVSGRTQHQTKVSAPVLPAQVEGPMLAPADMQLWLDTGEDAHGTTEITGRFLSMEMTIPTGVTYKWIATGPGGSLNYTKIGRTKSHPVLKMVFEFDDSDQYDLYADGTSDTRVKSRVRLNGPIIETTNRHFIEFDVTGPAEELEWDSHEDSNRTLEITIHGEYDEDMASDLIARVQNDSATL